MEAAGEVMPAAGNDVGLIEVLGPDVVWVAGVVVIEGVLGLIDVGGGVDVRVL